MVQCDPGIRVNRTSAPTVLKSWVSNHPSSPSETADEAGRLNCKKRVQTTGAGTLRGADDTPGDNAVLFHKAALVLHSRADAHRLLVSWRRRRAVRARYHRATDALGIGASAFANPCLLLAPDRSTPCLRRADAPAMQTGRTGSPSSPRWLQLCLPLYRSPGVSDRRGVRGPEGSDEDCSIFHKITAIMSSRFAVKF